ncbi:MAG: DNA mismatch repair endonuclease MutL, partial [Bacilli bacterium]
MGKIQILNEQLANQIAAGEVVERPASVVKELVENSVDAGSTHVQVFLEEAGIASIRVVDNGRGMSYDDAVTAFGRHATSKIANANDLFRIRTLGFRGEALPSIASVSDVTLLMSDGEEGAKVVMVGGTLRTHEPAPLRQGTDITVSNLFYNTPARLKYLKTTTTELGHTTDYLNRMALAHPRVRFELFANERLLFSTTGSGDVREAFARVYGMNIARSSFVLTHQTLDYTLTFVSAPPSVSRANRNYMSLYVNGRYFKNYVLTQAILEGFHTRLPIHRFPVCALMIEVDPYLVDVNVHPTKLEVRFSKEKEL